MKKLSEDLLTTLSPDGKVDRESFLRHVLSRDGLVKSGVLGAIMAQFVALDRDKSGALTLDDLRFVESPKARSRQSSGSM